MQKRFRASNHLGLLLSLFVLGLVAALVILPSQFRSEAGGNDKSKKAENLQEKFEDYDIRDQKSDEISDILMSFRQTAGRNASELADIRDAYVKGENTLRQRIPTLAVEYNPQLHNPEVIGLDVMKGGGVMTSASTIRHAETLRNFMKENDALIGLRDAQINNLKVTADYTNPNGELSFARLEQFINDIPVFRAEIRAGFNQKGEMFRVVNNLAPGLEYESLSSDFGNPADAVSRAAGYINYKLKESDTTLNSKTSTDLKAVFGEGDFATTAEKMYFPTEAGVARPSWRVLIWQSGATYYVVVDAETGTMLYRENITKDQMQSATYNVYANTNSILKTMANPAPLAVNPIDPTLGTQGTLQPRSNVTLIGNEGVYSFNNLGWITDNTNGVNGHTDGNNVEAGVDRVLPNGVDNVVAGTNRVFNFSYTPGAGASGGPGDNPTTTPAYQNGAGTNLFYVTNRYHDETYLLGFTEQARNFQNDNFGRGGVGADRVSAQAQDDTVDGISCSASPCANNANFATPADGGRGVMQMYIWNRMTPIRDGDLDAEIIVHELTHGLFGRLHNGVSGTQAGQMNEGNSDFFAHTLLSLDTDPIPGVYVTGGYSTLNLRTAAPFSNTGNYYYGIRRFPKAVIAFTGGPMNRPHNPLTYADIDPAQMNLSNGAFAPAFAGSATAVHDGGEIWSSMMWEVRAKLVARLGNVAGSKKVLQLAMDGMKVSPSNPTMLQERNAILAAAQSNGNAADIGDIWGGFALRGLGFGATNTTGNTVVESFSTPNAMMIDPFSVSDSPGDNDGFPEPGEPVLLSVSVNNPSGNTITNVVASVAGGGSANYGTMNNGDTVVRQIPYTIPVGATCGSLHDVSITVSSSAGTNTPQVKSFRLGAPVGGAPVTFSNATTIAVPGTGTSGVGAPYPSTITASGLSGNKIIKVELTNFSHMWTDDVDVLLVGPGGQKFIVLSDSGGNTRTNLGPHQLIFTDTAAAAIPDDGPLAAGTYKPSNVDTADTFAAPAPAGPYSSPAPGGSATFASVFGSDGATMNGTWSLYAVDDTGSDIGTIGGWKITFESDNYNCSFTAVTKSRADFDGDGKTDMSVFRPTEGNWYLNRSAAGIQVINWGISTDTLVPGDYDGDGKADTAVFRPSNSAGTPDFYILNSNGFTFSGAEWGLTGDKAVVGNFDGDAKDDIAVWRSSNGTFYILNSSNGSNTVEPFGTSGDLPLSMDTDGDGKTNLAVFRPSNNTWYIARNTGVPASNLDAYPFGLAGDKIVPADYDNDNKTDIAVYRNGQWIIKRSSDGVVSFLSWGNSTDVPVPGDYDGDGTDDLAIYRNGTWYINRSTSGALVVPFGITTDKPIPTAYIP